MGLRSIRIDLGYDGSEFFGSQRQAGVRTVQAELESALEQITGTACRTAFAGRTDRGVHATGQVASAKVFWGRELEQLRYALDSVTDDDMTVYRVADVEDHFHARYSALSREYRYRVYAGSRAPVLTRKLVWWIRSSPDLDRLNRASASLIGERDFRSFAGKGVGSGMSRLRTTRTVDVSEWRRIPNELERTGELYEFRIRANGFLPHMVRNLTGALISIGLGDEPESSMSELLDRRDRRFAPPPAPAKGLTLWRVEYQDETVEEKPGHTAGQEQE